MRPLLACGGGFLLAVLWFDLMFDVQVLGQPPGPLGEEILASIAGYYRRVTTEADPMGRLVGLVMIVTVAGTVYQLVRGEAVLWRRVLATLAVAVPVPLALLGVFPDAVRLATRADPVEIQSALARSICHAHLASFAAILLFIALQLAPVRGERRTP